MEEYILYTSDINLMPKVKVGKFAKTLKKEGGGGERGRGWHAKHASMGDFLVNK